MQFTRRNAAAAALPGAALVYVVALLVAPPDRPSPWHALVPAAGAVVGAVDLLLSLPSRRKS